MNHLLTDTCIVKRKTEVLDKYNRPKKSLQTIGEFPCRINRLRGGMTPIDPQHGLIAYYRLYLPAKTSLKVGDIVEANNTTYTVETPPYFLRTHVEADLKLATEV